MRGAYSGGFFLEKNENIDQWILPNVNLGESRFSYFRMCEIDIIITITVSPQPELTSTSTGKASMPLMSAVALPALWRDKAADKMRAGMGGFWAKTGARAMRFLCMAG